MDPGQWLIHVKLVQRAHQLTDAVGSLARKDHLPGLAALLERLAVVAQQPPASEVPDDLALVAHLVLEDNAVPQRQEASCKSASGCAALDLVTEAVFPAGPHSLLLMELVRCTSLQQAAAVCRACHIALRDVICDSGSCVQLLLAAEAHRWPTLESRCLEVAVANVRSLDAAAAQLSEHALLRILSSDHVEVDTEMDVWHVLAAWLDADLAARSRSVAPLMTGGVRLLQLSREQLNEVDSHPAVRSCGTSSRLVAAAYLHASGHCADICTQMASPPLWAQLATAPPRACLSKAAQPATPAQPVRTAAAATPNTDMSDDGGASPSSMLLDVTPMRLDANTILEAPVAMEIVALSPEDQWIISADEWEDATAATFEQLDLARHMKRLRSA